ncbi:MAG: M16 family metallopeptidase [Parvibaculales bacterium]
MNRVIRFGFLLMACLTLYAPILPAHAATNFKLEIKELVTPSGIRFWFVADTSRPIVSLKMAWKGGAVSEKPAQNGITQLMVNLLDEGAGGMSASEFQNALSAHGIRLSFSAGLETVTGSLQFLTHQQKQAFSLLNLALHEPRFDQEAVERMRALQISQRKRALSNPDVLNNENWWRLAYGNHAYARPVSGSQETIQSLTREQLVARHRAHLARDNLFIALVGHMQEDEAIVRVEEVFAALPAHAQLMQIEKKPLSQTTRASDKNQNRTKLIYPTPQSDIIFGLEGVPYQDADFFAAYVMNYILGGGGLSARLMEEIREKRGLAYSVYSSLYELDISALWTGNMASSPENVDLAIALLETEMQKLRQTPVSATELANAKAYLIGSYLFRFDSGEKIARQLLSMQLNGFDRDYPNLRQARIEAVQSADIQRVARRVLNPDNLLISVLTPPEKETE